MRPTAPRPALRGHDTPLSSDTARSGSPRRWCSSQPQAATCPPTSRTCDRCGRTRQPRSRTTSPRCPCLLPSSSATSPFCRSWCVQMMQAQRRRAAPCLSSLTQCLHAVVHRAAILGLAHQPDRAGVAVRVLAGNVSANLGGVRRAAGCRAMADCAGWGRVWGTLPDAQPAPLDGHVHRQETKVHCARHGRRRADGARGGAEDLLLPFCGGPSTTWHVTAAAAAAYDVAADGAAVMSGPEMRGGHRTRSLAARAS